MHDLLFISYVQYSFRSGPKRYTPSSGKISHRLRDDTNKLNFPPPCTCDLTISSLHTYASPLLAADIACSHVLRVLLFWLQSQVAQIMNYGLQPPAVQIPKHVRTRIRARGSPRLTIPRCSLKCSPGSDLYYYLPA